MQVLVIELPAPAVGVVLAVVNFHQEPIVDKLKELFLPLKDFILNESTQVDLLQLSYIVKSVFDVLKDVLYPDDMEFKFIIKEVEDNIVGS